MKKSDCTGAHLCCLVFGHVVRLQMLDLESNPGCVWTTEQLWKQEVFILVEYLQILLFMLLRNL